MTGWKSIADKAYSLLRSKDIVNAKHEIQAGLKRFPNQFKLLLIATNTWQASGNHEEALKYAQLIKIHHPKKWQGDELIVETLISLKQFDEAQEQIEIGLEKFPTQYELLELAIQVFRSSNDREKSLKYAKLIIKHHPQKWKGYGRGAQDLILLRRYNQAQKIIKQGLENCPDEPNLSKIAAHVYFVSGKFEKSIKHAYIAHKNGVILPRTTFNELLIYNSNQKIKKENQKIKDSIMAIDYYFNSRFILSHKNMPFNFFYAPKNACSSIKLSLIARFTELSRKEIKRNPHKSAAKFFKQKVDWSKDNYSLVRNPFTRFTSAFADKCGPGGDRIVWPELCRRYGFDETMKISMDQLLDALIADDPNLINAHFRPQHKVFCSTVITPLKIFYMERMNDLIAFLESHNTKLLRHTPHSTKAKAPKPNELEKGVVNKIIQLYSNDFALYGYSQDPNIKDITPPQTIPHVSELLARLDSLSESNNLNARDSLLFEDPFLESSLSLTTLSSNADKQIRQT